MKQIKIAVFSEKGGAGKSAFASAMAFALGYPVIDLDPPADRKRSREPA